MIWQIRRSKPEDLYKLRDIYLQARTTAFFWIDSSTFTLTDFDAATQDEPILVAHLDDTPIGFISWWPPDNFIHNLYVDPIVVGLGVGKALLNKCLAEIGRPAALKCLQKNTAALHFYQSQGWQIALAANATEGDYFLLSCID